MTTSRKMTTVEARLGEKHRMNDNYRTLSEKVDATFKRIANRHREQMRCGAGCHSCCLPGLAVSTVEKEAIKDHIEATPGLAEKMAANEVADPFNGSRCRFLGGEGECQVYEARPLICRSHGVPIRVTDGDTMSVSCCDLNFVDQKIEALGMSDLLNSDLINTLLALINEQTYGPVGRERYRLELREIMKPLPEEVTTPHSLPQESRSKSARQLEVES